MTSCYTENHASSRPPSTILSDDLWLLSSPVPIWIPDEEEDLQLRLIFNSHFGSAGHRGLSNKSRALANKFS